MVFGEGAHPCSKYREWEMDSFEPKVQIIWFTSFGYCFIIRIIGILEAGEKSFIFKDFFFKK